MKITESLLLLEPCFSTSVHTGGKDIAGSAHKLNCRPFSNTSITTVAIELVPPVLAHLHEAFTPKH